MTTLLKITLACSLVAIAGSCLVVFVLEPQPGEQGLSPGALVLYIITAANLLAAAGCAAHVVRTRRARRERATAHSKAGVA